MVKKEGSFLVQSPMCRFGMKMRDDHGEELHVRKETLWLTNSECIAEELRGVCENVATRARSPSACPPHRQGHVISFQVVF